jgi:hypothetical protein
MEERKDEMQNHEEKEKKEFEPAVESTLVGEVIHDLLYYIAFI